MTKVVQASIAVAMVAADTGGGSGDLVLVFGVHPSALEAALGCADGHEGSSVGGPEAVAIEVYYGHTGDGGGDGFSRSTVTGAFVSDVWERGGFVSVGVVLGV